MNEWGGWAVLCGGPLMVVGLWLFWIFKGPRHMVTRDDGTPEESL